ncbi:HAL/PAL/TAL family ammonia-lyase [Komagataeibacter europaeus]|uniref:HAL/PAL/TAL family ammonia-lyase n=1 Tax=Komagataeibacter europaeus TaxID=33995 RepID=UPI000B56C46B|nr:histidine ammonia-lyase [Komagataeibacter europaeus]ARW15907.1 Histidine ammonia-lyase [Komagataeibacter europaeus]
MKAHDICMGAAAPSITDIADIARRGAKLSLSAEGMCRIRAGRAVVERYVAENRVVYGLNTGLGASVDTALVDADMIAFQKRVPHSHSVGVGPVLPREEVRAMMAARVSGMAAGGTGASEGIVTGIVAALNAGVHPVIPAWGSIGAADLAPLAHMSMGLMGLGLAEYGESIMPAAEALARAGLEPLDIRIKDGHALIATNSLSTGAACLCLEDADRALSWSLRAIALNFEGFRANLATLDEEGLAARPAMGQQRAGACLRDLLVGSGLWAPGAARRLQDPLSYRCVPQVWGGFMHALDEARQATEIELGSSADNPVVLADTGRIVTTGNFDMTAFVLSWERLGQAIAHCATGTAHRCMKIMSPAVSDLPRFLAAKGQNRGGYAELQKTISAMEAEIRHLALPVSLSPIPVSDGIEDQSSMAPRVISKTQDIVRRFHYMVAMELLLSAEAVELRGVTDTLGEGILSVQKAIRDRVPALDEDRELGSSVMALVDMILS